MEYKWIGPVDEDPHHIFTCQPGGSLFDPKHADPCTCGEYKSVIDDLEVGYKAVKRFRDMVCANRGGPMSQNLSWDDMDRLTPKISHLEDRILKNLSNMLGGCSTENEDQKKNNKRRRVQDLDAVDKVDRDGDAMAPQRKRQLTHVAPDSIDSVPVNIAHLWVQNMLNPQLYPAHIPLIGVVEHLAVQTEEEEKLLLLHRAKKAKEEKEEEDALDSLTS